MRFLVWNEGLVVEAWISTSFGGRTPLSVVHMLVYGLMTARLHTLHNWVPPRSPLRPGTLTWQGKLAGVRAGLVLGG